MRALRLVFIALVCLVSMLTVTAGTVSPQSAVVDYSLLQNWRFSSQPVAIPFGGIVIERAGAKWTFESGEVKLMEPTSDGRITGLVFRGKGRFTMPVPDPVELRQLRRFAQRSDLQSIDEPFTELVLRASDDVIRKTWPDATVSSPAPDDLAKQVLGRWIDLMKEDVDARVVCGLLIPGDDYMRIGVDTADFGWLVWEYDPLRREEIRLARFNDGYTEEWLSLDRPEDRLKDGRPSDIRRPIVKLEHVLVKGDLRDVGAPLEDTGLNKIEAKFVVDETFDPVMAGAGAIELQLDPTAKVTGVYDENGKSLGFIRNHIGARSVSLDNREYDDDLLVVLDHPLEAGKKRTLRFEYDLEILNYAEGDSWYPTPLGSLMDEHTGRMELTVRNGSEVYAVGHHVETRKEDKGDVSVWEVDRPTMMMSFMTARRFSEKKIKVKNGPEVIAFGPRVGMRSGAKIENVAIDVSNSIQFFQWLLDSKLDLDTVYATGIVGYHGQSFRGFIHLAWDTFNGEHPGASELFRAHEVAHQWFGHQVGWTTYRDQWLSESLAEYAAMMFVQGTIKGGNKLFDEILMVDTNMVEGSLRGAMSKFARPWLLEMNASNRERMGPIGLGLRAGTREVPQAYYLQTYCKGPLVIHMLRTMLRDKTGDDKLFIKILRDYVHEYKGRTASTADFEAIVERDAPANWHWFFDEWIQGAEIPTYVWSYTIGPKSNGKCPITIDVTESGVPKDFMMPVPIGVELAGRKYATITMIVNQPHKTETYNLPLEPKKVVFNPDYSVLATVKKK